MFEKFTEGAIKVIMIAQEEARRMGHGFVGTEQMLLGVIGQRHGIGARALKKQRVTLLKTRQEIEEYVGPGRGYVTEEIPFTPRAKRVLEMSVQESKDLGQKHVGTEHLLLALIAEVEGVALRTLNKLDIDIRQLKLQIYEFIEEFHEKMARPISQTEKFLLERAKTGTSTPVLDEYGENLTKAAVDGELDPVLGRDEEILDTVSVLARRRKNNPVLVGEPGVGKTAIAEGLALLIISKEVPKFLEGAVLMALDIGSLLAGTKYRGEFEERLKRIVDEVRNEPSVIVVIDEIHTLVGAGAAEGAVDAANILKPALARGKFKCVGATTQEEYRKYIERDAALERRFQPVQVGEPTVDVTIEILMGLRLKLEEHHTLTYQDVAIKDAAILSDKFIADRFLPDKALDVLDEAGSRKRIENRNLPRMLKFCVKEVSDTIRDKERALREFKFDMAIQLLAHENEVRDYIRKGRLTMKLKKMSGDSGKAYLDMVTSEDVSDVISSWTGIPVANVSDTEAKRLLKMEETLHEKLIGQRHGVTAVSRAIRRARVGLRDTRRPIASFIFAGPTGVGKTELTKALAEYMFSKKDCLTRLDMSEYMEKHTVSKLIGSPPGYVGYSEGGRLTEAVRKTPYTLVLFDEIEKAHGDVYNLLLQVLDDGRLTDSSGRLVDFTNTLIVLTTNLGAGIIQLENNVKPRTGSPESEFQTSPHPVRGWDPGPEISTDPADLERITKRVIEHLKEHFRPEFLNRIDEIIVFNHLTRVDIWNICGLLITGLEERLKDKGIELVVETAVRAFLTDAGYDPIYGARPLRRAIMTYLEDALAEVCLSRALYVGTKFIVKRKRVSKFKFLNKLYVEIDNSVIPEAERRAREGDAAIDAEIAARKLKESEDEYGDD